MASEQVHRGEVFSETLLKIGDIHIQEQRKEEDRETLQFGTLDKERNEGEGGTNQKQQDIRELHAESKRRDEATKGLKDRKENSKYRAQNAIANTQEKAKQEASVQAPKGDAAARNKEVESKATRVTHNKETMERPTEKSTTKGFEEGKKKPVVVCETIVKVIPQKDNESNTMGSFQRVQERDKPKKQGVSGETKTQHAEKMNKNRESNVLATYAEVVKADDSAARRVKEQKLNENLVEKVFEEEKEQTQVSVVHNLHMVNESLDNKATEGGRTVLEAVGETVIEIGENILKPAKKVIEKSEERKEGGLLSAIGETVAEIAETTKVIAVGDGETDSKQKIESKAK